MDNDNNNYEFFCINILFCVCFQDAYALWACAAVLPHWIRTTAKQGRRGRYRVNACRSVCLDAEQKCPWLLPVADDANPYAGEASFTCIGKYIDDGKKYHPPLPTPN